jgi:predicted nucleotidyltransferase
MPELHPDTRGTYDVARIAKAAAATPGVSRVFVYGSAAWGGWEPGISDLDLMVEGEALSPTRLAGLLNNYTPGVVDIRHAADLTWHHLVDIRARGILIYDRSCRDDTDTDTGAAGV